MPQALPLPLREQIVQLHRDGLSLVQVAHRLKIKERTVRKIWRRFRDDGEPGLQTHYDRCGHPGIRFPASLQEAALTYKREHPRWGAGFIRVLLAERFPDEALPAERTLQQWFRATQLQPVPAQQPPMEEAQAKEVHEVWQMDAKERMRLADGSGTSTLTVTDERSGAQLATEVFPPVSLVASGGGDRPGGTAAGL